MKAQLFLYISIFLFSCSDSKVIDDAIGASDKNLYSNQGAIHNVLLPLAIRVEDAPSQMVEENFFGEFYCDRVMFFIQDNTAAKLYNASIDKITLYYIDGVLSKSKYTLKEDISSSLINDLGKLKILGFDYKNRELLEKNKILLKENDRYFLNEKLDNYRLKWTKEDEEIFLRVDKNNESEKFAYIKQVKDYEEQLNAIERQCR